MKPSAIPAGGEFTEDEARELWRLHRENRCDHCGASHARACPRVRGFKWHENGRIAEVEFWPDGQWPEENVMWPEALPPDPDQ